MCAVHCGVQLKLTHLIKWCTGTWDLYPVMVPL